MRVVFKDTFVNRLENQLDFIAKNSSSQARRFKNGLLTSIKEIPNNPLRYRKSIYFDSKDIRDLIYKGYTIVFRITDTHIEVFGFIKYQNSITD